MDGINNIMAIIMTDIVTMIVIIIKLYTRISV